MQKQYVLIGASAASFGALHSLQKLDPNAHITLISAENEKPYNKCKLADFLGGSISQEDLLLSSSSHENVSFIFGQKVHAIDSKNKKALTDVGQSFCYDALFLGMGSSPWIPDISGIKTKGVFTFHTHADAQSILHYSKEHSVKNVIVIGAGLSGLEAADALLKHHLAVTIIERNSQVLAGMLSHAAAGFLHTKIVQQGARLILNAAVNEVQSTNGCVTGILVNGQVMSADLVIIATGLQANTQLCRQAGIAVDAQGVIVNEYLQTNISDMYAGGDLIGSYDTVTGKKVRSCLWPDAMQQGMHAGMAMAGKPKAYAGMAMITSTAFFGIKYAKAGLLEGADGLLLKSGPDFHHTFLIKDEVLRAFQVLGNVHNLGALRRMLLTRQPITPDQLDF